MNIVFASLYIFNTIHSLLTNILDPKLILYWVQGTFFLFLCTFSIPYTVYWPIYYIQNSYYTEYSEHFFSFLCTFSVPYIQFIDQYTTHKNHIILGTGNPTCCHICVHKREVAVQQTSNIAGKEIYSNHESNICSSLFLIACYCRMYRKRRACIRKMSDTAARHVFVMGFIAKQRMPYSARERETSFPSRNAWQLWTFSLASALWQSWRRRLGPSAIFYQFWKNCSLYQKSKCYPRSAYVVWDNFGLSSLVWGLRNWMCNAKCVGRPAFTCTC